MVNLPHDSDMIPVSKLSREVFSVNNSDNADYFSLPSINFSGLSTFKKSPAHYFAEYLAPDREPRVETPAMRLGSAIHCYILEPEAFNTRYAVAPEGLDRRTKEGKAAFAELEASGKTVISATDYKTAEGVARSLRAHPLAGDVFDNLIFREQVFTWDDPITGEPCKAKIDGYTQDGILIDIKSTEDASTDSFMRSIARYGYHRQAAWYMDAVAHNNLKVQIYLIAAFEKARPYACQFFYLDHEAIRAGRDENRLLLDRFSECKKQNYWPGYSEKIEQIGLPGWYQSGISLGEYL